RHLDEPIMSMLLAIPFEMKQRNVKKVRLGTIYNRVVSM
ncbi:unnamed protein product, partial [Rotaria magnacalcarata]